MTERQSRVSNREMQDSSSSIYSEIEDEIDFRAFLFFFIKNWKLILFCTFISASAAITIALLSTPIYRAEVLLAPTMKDGRNRLGAISSQIGGFASLVGINPGSSNADTLEAIATMNSRDFTNKFMHDENLLPVLFEQRWDVVNKTWKKGIKPPTLWDAYEKFSRKVRSVSHDKKTGLITLAVEWRDPRLAADWANKLVKQINEKLRNEAIVNADKSIKYLQKELSKTSVIEIKQSIYNIIEAQTKNKMLANTQEEYVFRVIDSATVPEKRIKPNRKMMVFFGLVIGVMAGAFVAFLVNWFRKSKY